MKYAKTSDDGYVIYFIDSPIEQDGMSLIDYDVPPCPETGYKFNVNTKTWEDGTQQQKYASAVINVRASRASLLEKSDWTQLPNGPLTAEKQAEWQTYRQALRDITTQSGYPYTVSWPTKPS